MLRLEHVQDLETLRQIAALLDRENQKLLDRIRHLTGEDSRLKGQDAAVQRELELLKKLLAPRGRALLAESSERRPRLAEAPEPRAPQRGHGPKAQPELPIVEQVHELPPEERRCEVFGGELSAMGDQAEESEEITVIQRHFTLEKHRRLLILRFDLASPRPATNPAGSEPQTSAARCTGESTCGGKIRAGNTYNR